MTQSVYVQPWFNPSYYAYMLEGLRAAYPEARLRLTTAGFPDLRLPGWYRQRDTFAFRVDDLRITVSANDMTAIHEEHVAWAHAHGKVNIAPEGHVPVKVVAIGPLFGIRHHTRATAAGHALAHVPFKAPGGWGPRQLVATLRQEQTRSPITAYHEGADAAGRIFYQGLYWAKHAEANGPRVRFLRAVRRVQGDASGGLVFRGPVPSGLQALSVDAIPHGEYLAKVRASPLVFNHDAVHSCLGWKLGEYLALGKAILTTPIRNRLPEPLRHGHECHIVEDHEEAMAEGVRLLLDDIDYRHHLEGGADRWYREHLAPSAVIERLVAKAKGCA